MGALLLAARDTALFLATVVLYGALLAACASPPARTAPSPEAGPSTCLLPSSVEITYRDGTVETVPGLTYYRCPREGKAPASTRPAIAAAGSG